MRIYGAKGGSGRSHTPVEAPETGRSKQIVKIVEVISEGEIDGLVDELKSVYLDDTPVRNANGSYNFNNVSGELNVGTQTQSPLDGYESSQNEVSVGVEVKKNTGAIVRTITDERITRLRLTIGVKSLFEQNSQGDTNATSVTMRIKVGSKTQDYVIRGKYSSQYLEAVEFGSLPAVPFNISVERVTADSNKNTLQNGTLWSAYTEIIDTEFCYPNTALAGVSLDSDYFNGIPARNYLVRGIKVKVPSNYNPETRVYTGLWDGTFKIAWTDNPAWILMDIITNERYGLGGLLGSFSCDKWTLYDIARYCDTMVDDGFGGKEPRFTCNAWITDISDAYTLLNNICSIFRAIPVWTGQEYSAIMDRPSDPSWTYTNANVIDGIFERSYSAKKSRHNAVKVTYSDKNNAYKSAVEYVSDDASIAKNGLNLTEITAFGCTSRGQAYRTGRWLIETEKLEKETITFTVGREGLMHLPGDIIRVSDNHYAGLNIGGRVVSVSGNKVTLDREVKLSGATNLTYINKSAKETTIRITAANGNVVTLASTPNDIEPMTVWSLSTSTVTSGLYKAISLTENDDGTFKIVALQHEPQKEAIVDKSAHFVPTNKTAYRAPQINNVDAKTGYDGKLYVTVDVGSGDGELTYDVRILKDGYLYEYRRGLTDPNISFENLPNGEYTVVIYAKNKRGQVVSEKTTTFTIDKPPAPTGVLVTGGLGEITIEWDWVDDVTYTEIFASEDTNFANATKVAKVLSKLYSHSVGAKQTRYYWLRHVRGINNGPFYQEAGIKGESAVDIDEKLDKLNKELSKNIVNEVIDTALPARNLGMTLYVKNLDVNTYLGQNQVYDETANKLYAWNGTKYVAIETELLASAIKGIIRPEQLAAIPATKLSGTITDSQLSEISANKISGTIAANQLAAIPTTKLTGTIAANQIAANSIGANAIQAGIIGTIHLSADSVGASQLQANSVGANAIQANAVTTDKLSANSVDTGKIKAGAINANHIAAGQLTSDKFVSGLGGNLLYNPIFADNGYGWGASTQTATSQSACTIEHRKRNNTVDWYPQDALPNENVRFMAVNAKAGVNLGWADPMYRTVFLTPGKWYMYSLYANTYRFGNAYLLVEEYTADGTAFVKSITSQSTPQIAGSAKNTIAGMSRWWVKFKCPDSGAVSLRFRTTGVATGEWPNVYVARPMLEECTQYSTEPSAWQNAGVTSIHGGSIVSKTITTDKLGANSVTANEIAAGAVAAKHIAANTISATHIVSKGITADKLNVTSLSALSANMGSITAGSMKIGALSGNYGTLFEVASNGGFRLVSRDSSGGIELSSSARALTVWNGNTIAVKTGKL